PVLAVVRVTQPRPVGASRVPSKVLTATAESSATQKGDLEAWMDAVDQRVFAREGLAENGVLRTTLASLARLHDPDAKVTHVFAIALRDRTGAPAGSLAHFGAGRDALPSWDETLLVQL